MTTQQFPSGTIPACSWTVVELALDSVGAHAPGGACPDDIEAARDEAAGACVAALLPLGCLGGARVGSAGFQAFVPLGTSEVAVRAALEEAGQPPNRFVSLSVLQDGRWVEEFNRSLRPVDVGRRFTILPHPGEPGPGRLALCVEPGRAFGTGHHESTRLALTWIEDVTGRGATVLDVGTGSGILAAASARLGAQCVHATDVDPEAVEVARANAAFVPEHAVLAFETAPGVGSFTGTADVVVANITVDVVLELLSALERHLAPTGALVLSGLLGCDEPRIEAALAALGLVPEWRREGEWSSCAARRRA